jgi:hypothetical protein
MATPLAQEESGDLYSKIRRVRPLAIALGFLLCLPVCLAISSQPQSGIFSLMVPPVSALLAMVVVNVPLRRFLPKHALTQSDLIMIFVIVSVAASIAGEWANNTFPVTYIYPILSKTNPTVKNYFVKYVPDAFAIKDPNSVRDMLDGGKSWTYALSRLPALFPQYLTWGGVVLCTCFAMLCINSLMRGAWCERERLTFPLIQLPVAMSEDGGAGGMWRSRYMWIAFAVMFSIDILNGLNYLYPNLPSIPVKDLFYIDRVFKDPPWSNIGDFRIAIYPFMAAIGLFMPSDLLLSFVVFFLLRKATHVILASQGIPQQTFSGTATSPGPPYFDEQTWGAVLAMFLGAWRSSREYVKEVWRDIRSGQGSTDGGVKHRYAFLGLLGATAVVVGYGAWGGLPVIYMIPYIALFYIFSIVLTRIRAQLGPPTHEFAYFGPTSFMNRFLGTRWLSNRQAAYEEQVFIFINRISRNHPMPYQLEGMKMSSTERLNQRTVFVCIALATVVGLFLSYIFAEMKLFRTGQIGSTDAIGYLENLMKDRHGTDTVGIVMTIFGFAVVLILDSIRFRIPGFPLHPAGYVLSMNFGVDYYWFGLLIALIVKNFVQRYYGLRGYDKLRAVALGILLGEYAAETIWMTMALITKQSTYTISFNDRSLGVQ